jgi:hypothetical protein
LARLPKAGDAWAKPQRKLWLQLLEGSFELIYRDSALEGVSAQGSAGSIAGEKSEAAN